MAAINFQLSENQVIWDKYFTFKMEEWKEQNEERLIATEWTEEEQKQYSKKQVVRNTTPYTYEEWKKRQTLAQYKPILREFEKFAQKPFDKITRDQYDQFKAATTKKGHIVHMQGFFIDCIGKGIITINDKEFIKGLIPTIYQPLMKFL